MFIVILFSPSFPLPSPLHPPWFGCVRVAAEGRKGGQRLNGCTSRFWQRRMCLFSPSFLVCVCCVRFDWVGVVDGEITSGLNRMDRGDSSSHPPSPFFQLPPCCVDVPSHSFFLPFPTSHRSPSMIPAALERHNI